MTVPCEDCRDRNEYCHAACERYKAYHMERQAFLEQRHKDKEQRMFTDGMRRAVKRKERARQKGRK